MSDEPDEAGDSGSDAAGASSSSDSTDSSAADEESSPNGSDDAPTEDDGTSPSTDDSTSDEDADSTDVDGSTYDSTNDEDVDSADVDGPVDESTSDDGADENTSDDETRETAEDAAGGDATVPDVPGAPDVLSPSGAGEDQPKASTADDSADSVDTTDSGDESGDEGSDDDSGEDGDVSDLAPVGADAPSPDEGEAATETSSTGDAAASATDAGESYGSSILSGGIGGSAPPNDEEMPLTEHIEEMLTRLAIVVVVAAVATLVAFPFANDLIINMWYDVHSGSVDACKTAPQSDGCVAPHVYGPLELVLTRIRVAGLAGLLVALPLGVYQTYRFMRPGLYPQERRYFLASVPFSLVLGIVGMVFAYFVLLPLLFAYFINYTEGSADLAFQLAETMNLILLMMGMLAIIFQIPLLIMLAIMMGITTRRWLESRRLYFWGLFLGVAVIFGPDPTGMAPFLLTATMVALFEGTLLLLRWTGR